MNLFNFKLNIPSPLKDINFHLRIIQLVKSDVIFYGLSIFLFYYIFYSSASTHFIPKSLKSSILRTFMMREEYTLARSRATF